MKAKGQLVLTLKRSCSAVITRSRSCNKNRYLARVGSRMKLFVFNYIRFLSVSNLTQEATIIPRQVDKALFLMQFALI